MSFIKKYGYFIASGILFVIFLVFTILVKTVDVHYYFNNTYIGFYSINSKFGEFVTNFGKYEPMGKISDIILYLSFGYILVLFIFAVVELIKKKSFKKLNRNYYVVLGGYIATVVLYLIFEICKVNYSPDSVVGELKASYPSSHIFIGCMFFLLNTYTAMKLLDPEKEWIKPVVYFSTVVICLLEVFTRAMSAKHWLTDIIGSIILVSTLYTLFIGVSHKLVPISPKKEEVEETEIE